jgi:hypothetical protein
VNPLTAKKETAAAFAAFNILAMLEKGVLMKASLCSETLADFKRLSEPCLDGDRLSKTSNITKKVKELSILCH